MVPLGPYLLIPTYKMQPWNTAANKMSVLTVLSRVLLFFLNSPELQHEISRKLLGDTVDITFLVEIRGFSGIQFKYLEQ